ncbi:MAG TPA: gliding motility lipoprotein GldB [Cytophagaceae bacterium]
MKQLIIGFIVLVLIATSCTDNDQCKHKIDVSNVNVNVKVNRLEHELFEFKSPADAKAFIKKHPGTIQKFMEVPLSDSSFASHLYQYYSNQALKEFNELTQQGFSDLKSITDETTEMLKHVKYYYPDFYIPEINTIVTGFVLGKDLLVEDSSITISIDYFLGPGAKYRPALYEYFLERYRKEFINPMIALAISTKYNEVDMEESTMLGTMIYYGKAMYFAKRIMPCAHDSLITMYSGQQLKDVNDNLDVIWAHFLDKQLLYETNHELIKIYCDESPKVNRIGEKCPGRIGRWLGYEIVKKYMEENPSVTLQDLMKEKDAKKIFTQSKYKPRK